VARRFYWTCRQSRGTSGPGILWSIRSSGQVQPNFLAVLRILIILFNSFTNFGGGNPHDRIRIGVIVGEAAENFHTQDSLFELIRLASQRVRDHIFQEAGIAFAGIE